MLPEEYPMDKKPVRLDRRTIYENSWLNLYVDRIQMPAGRIVEEHHVLEFGKEAVAVVVNNDNGETLFIRAYRYVLDSLDWEVPAGVIEENESVIDAARRETLEETGYHTHDHRHIYTFYPISGIGNKRFHVVICRAGEQTGQYDSNEVQQYKWFDAGSVKELIKNGDIRDGLSLTALLLGIVS
jgi:ADP-ribose pyrophosphatase